MPQRHLHDPDNYLFQATFQNAAVGMAHVGTDGAWLRVNDRLCEIVGYAEEELTAITFQDITHPDDLNADLHLFEPMMRGELEGDGYQMEKRYYRKDGTLIWVNLTTALQRDQAGEPLFCISVVEDITERKRYEAHLETVSNELNHRVKNTLTIVQSIAMRSFPEGRALADSKADFVQRIQALASAHALLTDESWVGAKIGDLVKRTLSPYCDVGSDHCVIEGPDHWLPSRTAVSLAMALNELATNAVKHGALGVPEGRIEVRWTCTPHERDEESHLCEVDWVERGGPRVREPEGSGFGMVLIKGLLPSETDGRAEVRFEEAGLTARFAFVAKRADVPA